jgi:hypothetical protein
MTGQKRTGEDKKGQDNASQSRTGQDRTGQDRPRYDTTGQDRTGQDMCSHLVHSSIPSRRILSFAFAFSSALAFMALIYGREGWGGRDESNREGKGLS